VVVVAVLAALLLQMGEVVVLVLSSSVTLALSVVQVAHIPRLVEIQSIPLQQAGHTQHEYEVSWWVHHKKPSGSVIGGGVWYLVARSGRAKHQGQHMALGGYNPDPFIAVSV
jgi:hypothetical protein